jgi:hypothetical protein
MYLTNNNAYKLSHEVPCISVYASVFRIRDILVRIRILGTVPLTNGSGSTASASDLASDPALFVSGLQDANKKLFFFYVFLLITF